LLATAFNYINRKDHTYISLTRLWRRVYAAETSSLLLEQTNIPSTSE